MVLSSLTAIKKGSSGFGGTAWWAQTQHTKAVCVAIIMACVASALGDQWYHVIPVGEWEKPTAHGLFGCALDLTGFCMEKL